MERLFVYGTLMAPAVFRDVVGREPRFSSAELPGFRRCRLLGERYPAAVPDPAGTISGQLVLVGAPELSRLDAFEGQEYRRAEVRVSVAGFEQSAWTYVYADLASTRLVHADWDFEPFLTECESWLKEVR